MNSKAVWAQTCNILLATWSFFYMVKFLWELVPATADNGNRIMVQTMFWFAIGATMVWNVTVLSLAAASKFPGAKALLTDNIDWMFRLAMAVLIGFTITVAIGGPIGVTFWVTGIFLGSPALGISLILSDIFFTELRRWISQ